MEMRSGHLSRGRPASDAGKVPEQPTEKKKVSWMKLIKPSNVEKDQWVPDEAVSKCTACGADFEAFVHRQHCRNWGDIFCNKCTHGRIALTAGDNVQPMTGAWLGFHKV
ncbi:protein FREE1-like [Carex rostrata]